MTGQPYEGRRIRLLIHYSTFPEFDMNSGAYRLSEIVAELIRRRFEVCFLAARTTDNKYQTALEVLGVQCYDIVSAGFEESTQKFAEFLRAKDFDVAVMVQYPEFAKLAPAIATFLPRCRLVLDTVDLHFVRYQREADLTDSIEFHERARAVEHNEMMAVERADQVWVVTDPEMTILKSRIRDKDVRVIPNIHRAMSSIHSFNQRNGIVFLGSYRHRPNVDAVHFFMKEVLPLVRVELPEAKVSIVGSRPPDEFQQYHAPNEGIVVTGFVPDHHSVLLEHRVGIAPLRFGAGMKGKIGEYFACGLPCVTTGVGAEGMDLRDGEHVLIADDPIRFAKAVVRLYRDLALWEHLQAAGLAWIQGTVSPTAVGAVVEAALRDVVACPVKQILRPQRTILAGLAPHRLGRLLRESWRVFRSGGWRELRNRIRVWKQNG